MAIFAETKSWSKIYMKLQGTFNIQNILEKDEKRWKTHTFQFQNLLQSYSNQNVVVSA